MVSLELEARFARGSPWRKLVCRQPINLRAHGLSKIGKLMEMTEIRAPSITAFRIVSRFLSQGGR